MADSDEQRAIGKLATDRTRSAAEWVPIAGPGFGIVRANVDVHRANRAADSIIGDLGTR